MTIDLIDPLWRRVLILFPAGRQPAVNISITGAVVACPRWRCVLPEAVQ